MLTFKPVTKPHKDFNEAPRRRFESFLEGRGRLGMEVYAYNPGMLSVCQMGVTELNLAEELSDSDTLCAGSTQRQPDWLWYLPGASVEHMSGTVSGWSWRLGHGYHV